MRILFALAGLVFSTASAIAGTEVCLFAKCMAVVDAGSTGSRLHVYSYKLTSSGPSSIEEVYSKKVTPGLSGIQADQATINTYMDSLFSGTTGRSIPLYFYATGGMRLLPPPQQKSYYGLVNNWVEGKSQWALKALRTATGSEEGVWGWLSVNYQLGILQSPLATPAGVMDMGGASVQVTFPIKNSVNTDPANVVKFRLYGRDFRLFTHTFLGLGQTEVFHQYANSNACYPTGYPLPEGRAAVGNARVCEGEVTKLVNGVHGVESKVRYTLQNGSQSAWYTLGGLAYLVKAQPFNYRDDVSFTPASLLYEADNAACTQSWGTLSERYPTNDYLYGTCFFPAYYSALMVNGYGLAADTEIKTLPAKASSDWTLGVVLHQS